MRDWLACWSRAAWVTSTGEDGGGGYINRKGTFVWKTRE